ncbi:hypothetical protein [Flavobacterium sp. 3-210]
MPKLEEITEKARTIRKKISAFQKLRSICVRFSVHYYREGNTSMNDLMKLRLAKADAQLMELYTAIIPVEKERQDLLSKEPQVTTHKVVKLNIKHYESWMH